MKLISAIVVIGLLVIPAGRVLASDGLAPITHLGAGVVTSLAWRPDGTILAIGTRSEIEFFDARFKFISALDLPIGEWQVSWDPSGDQLAVVSNNPCKLQIWQISLHDTTKPILSNEYHFCGTLRWRYDGQQFGVLTAEKRLAVVDQASSKSNVLVFYGVMDFSWQRHGDHLAFVTHDQSLFIWASVTRIITRQIARAGRSVEWSPDDSQLATVSISGTKIIEPEWMVVDTKMRVRSFNAINFWVAATGTLSHQTVMKGDLTTVFNAHWVSTRSVVGYCFAIGDIASYGLCFGSVSAKSIQFGYDLGGGDSSASDAEWSPDRQHFFSYLYWRATELRVGKQGIEQTDFADIHASVSVAAWTSNSQYITVVDENGNLYQVQPDAVIFPDIF